VLAGLAGAGVLPARAILPAEGSGGLAVLYPDIGEPFRSVFASILDGIREQVRQPVPAFAVAGDSPPFNLRNCAGARCGSSSRWGAAD
jgi:putative tryptophan/tyrosine transport system substrate-binding protein